MLCGLFYNLIQFLYGTDKYDIWCIMGLMTIVLSSLKLKVFIFFEAYKYLKFGG